MLNFSQINYKYSSRSIFRGLNLQINDAKTVITGPNGCGKTTLLLLSGGILLPQQGIIELNGEDVARPSTKTKIGVSASGIHLPEFITAKELMSFHATQFNLSEQELKINSWSQRFNIEPFMNTLVSNLSLGNNKKLSLILALLHQPDLLLLDEPTNGLDDQGLQVLDEVLNEFSGQIVMASHDANTELMSNMTELPISMLKSD